MNKRKLYKATDVAKLCDVDLKTIHNWVDRGHLVAFRTPGRHLRFELENIVAFLKSFGYPIPSELRDTTEPTPTGAGVAIGNGGPRVLTDAQATAAAEWQALDDEVRQAWLHASNSRMLPSRGREAILGLMMAFAPKAGGTEAEGSTA